MTQFMHWTATQLSRRTFLKRTLAGAFAVAAGAAVRAPVAVAATCTGPFGTGRCASYLCSGAHCTSGQGITCTAITGFCPGGGSCWTSGGTTCCECFCHVDPPINWYCYCQSP